MDYYRQKASEMFGVPYNKVTPSQRQAAKHTFWQDAYKSGINLRRLKR